MMKARLTVLAIVLSFLFISSSAYAAWWKVPETYATIQEAIDDENVQDGDVILVGEGNFDGASVNKAVTIKGRNGTTIDGGPEHPNGLIFGFRLLAGSDGAKFKGLTFTVDLAIYNSDGVDDVRVLGCRFKNSLQAVSNWGGSGWKIRDNTIKDLSTWNGGGIGILVGERKGGIVENNVVADNDISGTLFVGGACPDDPACENGGYDGTGIVLYADFRYAGYTGAEALRDNVIKENRISLTSDNPDLVNACGIELTDSREEIPAPAVYNNRVRENEIEGVSGYGIAVNGAADNRFRNNNIEESGILDIFDGTTGSGTAGTANIWRDNDCSTSEPEGLCCEEGDGDDEDEDEEDDD